MFEPSKYQLAIFNAVANTNSNILINSVAGSGKSTSIVNAVNYIPSLDKKKIVFLAFNKHIAEELKNRLPKNVKSSTIHSLGFAIIKRNNPKAQINQDKVYDVLEQLKTNWILPEEGKIAFFNRIKNLVDLARAYWDGAAGIDTMSKLAGQFGISTADNEDDYAFEAFQRVVNDKKTFDFPDMVFMPIKNNYNFLEYDVVFCDEVQDLSFIERQFMLKLVKSGGRFIAVGDPLQSINLFKGASKDSFHELKKINNTIELPLSISYRCAQSIVDWAKEISPAMEARPNAPAGTLVFNGQVNNIRPGDMVLCRLNAPLIALALEFIKVGRPVLIKGKDIGNNLIKLIEPYKNKTQQQVIDKLNNKVSKLVQKIKKRNPTKSAEDDSEVVLLRDKTDILVTLLEKFGSVYKVIEFIGSIYSDVSDAKKSIFSTIHRAKGDEADRVFILEPQLVPFPFATTDDEREQEKHIDFVARTRAKNHLEYIKDYSNWNKKNPDILPLFLPLK